MVAPCLGERSMEIRQLRREEIDSVWTIDRREVIDAIYALQDGQLVLKPQHWDISGWPPGEREAYTPLLLDCFDRGGAFSGAYANGLLVGVVALESRLIGARQDQVQLKFLHVSQSHRKQGLGRALFERAVEQARLLGAAKLYVSATPSRNTVDFYRHLGCRVAAEVDPELWALEPEDIHLEYVIPERATGRRPAAEHRAGGSGPVLLAVEGKQRR